MRYITVFQVILFHLSHSLEFGRCRNAMKESKWGLGRRWRSLVGEAGGGDDVTGCGGSACRGGDCVSGVVGLEVV